MRVFKCWSRVSSSSLSNVLTFIKALKLVLDQRTRLLWFSVTALLFNSDEVSRRTGPEGHGQVSFFTITLSSLFISIHLSSFNPPLLPRRGLRYLSVAGNLAVFYIPHLAILLFLPLSLFLSLSFLLTLSHPWAAVWLSYQVSLLLSSGNDEADTRRDFPPC